MAPGQGMSVNESTLNAEVGRASRLAGSGWGPTILATGRVRFRIWAPGVEQVGVALGDGDTPLTMTPAEGGWHELTTTRAAPGALYRFVLPDGTRVPDPASRFQPQDVQGPSEVIDPAAYAWTDTTWRGRPWHEAIIYEMHVGSFTPEGTFRAAAEKLAHLVNLGVTAIELMPIGDFAGTRNWGYDGVLPFAPDSSYGRPEELKALIDAAHQQGLIVFLDVVYNHFGPEGNYLSRYAPQFFTDRHQTPWGAGINFDGPESGPVREYFIENALYWIDEFHFDGLRLDAVHAILDDSATHILDELARRVRDATRGRHIHLILENEANEARRLVRTSDGSPKFYTAQWNDDVHHVLHTAATGELSGYYADYHGDEEKLGRALAEGFAFQGEHMGYRGSPRGEPCAFLAPDAFIAFIQNHDQIGNRAFGERLGEIAPVEALRATVAIYLLLPQIPMLFMGEEWQTSKPFPFFCDFHGELAEAVSAGRRAEFARFPEFQDPESRARIPDPQSPETFQSAKLDWDDVPSSFHAAWLERYRQLLAVRRREIVPRLVRIGGHAGRYKVIGPAAVCVQWQVGAREELMLLANLCHTPLEKVRAAEARVIWKEGGGLENGVLAPWTARWSVGRSTG
jgi:malto-oligosyltrehalose trehalohydrolase